MTMYTLNHEGEKVGVSKLESGDPSIFSVSGIFNNIGGAKPLAAWIKSIGGAEDDGVVFIALNEAFNVVNSDGHSISFQEGNLIAIPNDDEVYLDLTGVSEEDYAANFSSHLNALAEGE